MEGDDGRDDQTGESLWAPVTLRLRLPVGQWSFRTVFVLGVLVLGYLAVWIEEGHVWSKPRPLSDVDLEPLRLAYATAILAVAAPCLMQLFLASKRMITVVTIALTVAVGWLAYLVATDAQSLCLIHRDGLPGLVLAAFAWWLANGEDPLFQDRIPTNGPSGGPDPQGELSVGKSKVTT